LVADLHRHWHRERGLPGRRLLVEPFILIKPWWALRTGSVPFWMTFNTGPPPNGSSGTSMAPSLTTTSA
jgi:hypothetical protein